MGSEGPASSLCEWKSGIGVTGRPSEGVWKGFSSSTTVLDGLSGSHGPSGGLVAGVVKEELICRGEEGGSSRVVSSSPAVSWEVSLSALDFRGSSSEQYDNQKCKEKVTDIKTHCRHS